MKVVTERIKNHRMCDLCTNENVVYIRLVGDFGGLHVITLCDECLKQFKEKIKLIGE